MGNRANVKLVEGDRAIYLYSHNDGQRLADVVAGAVNSRPAQMRVADVDYFTRIVIQRTLDEMADADADSGFGIGFTEPDGSTVLTVDLTDGTYRLP